MDGGRLLTEGGVKRRLTDRELAMLRSRQDRMERYVRTARFVQSTWFMVGASVGIAVFLLIIFLISR